MKPMMINGHAIVVSAFAENLTPLKAIGRLSHNIRELEQTKRIKYLRKSTKLNQYLVQNQFGSLVSHSGIALKHHEIEQLVMDKLAAYKKDYESQSITDKNGNNKKRSWQKKMTPFTEILLTFGTTRVKEKNEGLDDDETNFINSLDMMRNVMAFVSKYCKKHDVECIAIAEHNDEKTKHFQIIFSNYSYNLHTCHRRDKKQLAIYGSNLQDLAASAFQGIAIRGIKGSKVIHKDLTKMHESEKIYNSQVKLKEELADKVIASIGNLFEEKRTWFGKEYATITEKNAEILVERVVNMLIKQSNISIISNDELRSKIDELTKQLIATGAIMLKNKGLEQENTSLSQANHELAIENEALRQTNANLNNQDSIIQTQTNRISELEFQNLDMHNKLIASEQSCKMATSDINRLRSQLSEIIEKNEQLQANIESLNLAVSTNAILHDIIAKEGDKVATLRSELNDAKEQLKKTQHIQDVVDELNNTNVTIKRKLDIKDNEIKELAAALEQRDGEIKVLKSFKQKMISFVAKIAGLFPNIKEYIASDIPEIYGEAHRKNMPKAPSDQNFNMGDR